MIAIPFRDYNFKYKIIAGKRYIFDRCRKKFIMLNPEEWVRQNLLMYLIEDLKYPAGLISVEKEIKVNQLRKRYDIIVYNHDRQPWMLVECKAPEIPITDQSLNQLLSYYRVIQCPFWLLSNGRQTFCAAVHNGSVGWLHSLPVYEL